MRAENRTRGYREIEPKKRVGEPGRTTSKKSTTDRKPRVGGRREGAGWGQRWDPASHTGRPPEIQSGPLLSFFILSSDWRHALIILVSRGAIRGANLLKSSLRSQASGSPRVVIPREVLVRDTLPRCLVYRAIVTMNCWNHRGNFPVRWTTGLDRRIAPCGIVLFRG